MFGLEVRSVGAQAYEHRKVRQEHRPFAENHHVVHTDVAGHWGGDWAITSRAPPLVPTASPNANSSRRLRDILSKRLFVDTPAFMFLVMAPSYNAEIFP